MVAEGVEEWFKSRAKMHPDAIEYEISVVENFLTEFLGSPGNE